MANSRPGHHVTAAGLGLGLETGWLVIFDRREGQPPISERTTASPATTPGGRTVTVIRA